MKYSTAAGLILLILAAAAAILYVVDKKATATVPPTANPDPKALATNADVVRALNNITFKIQ